MKTLKFFLVALAVSFATSTYAQTADEIINNYFENTGGMDAWNKIEGLKMSAKVNNGGMEIPIEITQLKSGKQMTVISFQGKEIKQGVFDGETLWSTNFMTQKAEKSDAETTANFKNEINDFPDAFLNYKDKGYTVELLGKEEIDGTECFKIKLVREPLTIDGQQEDDISFYFFDPENFVPIGMHREIKMGQAKGMTSEITFSDYQEVDGIYLPFSMTQGIKGQGGQPITMEKIELNPVVDDKEFMFPEETAEEKKDGNENKN
ncbi:MAG: outer membrane lipoprotein-sorting protein [Flavobacteriaceae bacterium]|nr:outer membrane lipoprotein-sorting protein [Bacteroidia bacterium]MBT8288215.1 outer membrane lipoprotein-sorting protein [Bacteroidia bacterium]NNF75525.1 outer membrane lipoprotein-sorting protein [Flavobacteriaceae bacterium]NNK72291.1 outer membrane lipoprotein-sorting protein [Flavobacteriaceae bacterium]